MKAFLIAMIVWEGLGAFLNLLILAMGTSEKPVVQVLNSILGAGTCGWAIYLLHGLPA